MLMGMTQRLPGIEFDRYWPARHPGGRDYAQGRSQRIRRLYWLLALLGPMIPAVIAVTRPATRTGGIIAVAVIATLAVTILVVALVKPSPPSGVYEVDEEGEPLEYLGPQLPVELRNVRGVTHEAFTASVKARRARS